MDGQPGGRDHRLGYDVARAGRLQHFGGLLDGLAHHRALVLAPVAADAERGDAPGIDLLGVEGHMVLLPRETLAEGVQPELPRPRAGELALEVGSEARHGDPASPSHALRGPLEPVAAHEIGGRLGDVGETGDVDAVGTPAARGAVLPAIEDGARVVAHGVVHEVLAEHAARVGQAVGEVGRRRVEEDARRFKGRSPEEDGARVELQLLVGLAVDYAHAGYASAPRVPDDAGHHAVGAESQAAGRFRRGQGRVDGAEVAAGAAAAVAGAAVVAGAAALVIAGEHGRAADGHAPGSAERAPDRIPHVLLDA